MNYYPFYFSFFLFIFTSVVISQDACTFDGNCRKGNCQPMKEVQLEFESKSCVCRDGWEGPTCEEKKKASIQIQNNQTFPSIPIATSIVENKSNDLQVDKTRDTARINNISPSEERNPLSSSRNARGMSHTFSGVFIITSILILFAIGGIIGTFNAWKGDRSTDCERTISSDSMQFDEDNILKIENGDERSTTTSDTAVMDTVVIVQ